MNIQTDPRWINEIMTKKDGVWTDTLGRYGCLVTCLANIIETIMISKTFTPKDLNDMIKYCNAYRYLKNPNCKENEASFLEWDRFRDIFKSLDISLYEKEYHNNKNSYYIARVIHPKTSMGHYINVLNKKHKDIYYCFDVEDGRTRFYTPDEIVFFHRIATGKNFHDIGGCYG